MHRAEIDRAAAGGDQRVWPGRRRTRSRRARGRRTQGCLSRIDLNLLVALDALLTERSVTKAAARVGLGQSATSHNLARLRSLFGDELLTLSPEGMRPIPRALALVDPVRIALADIACG
jgi:hypothetical protein